MKVFRGAYLKPKVRRREDPLEFTFLAIAVITWMAYLILRG